MLAKVYSAAVIGVEAYEVEIEVDAGSGTQKIIVVGLPDAAVKESKDRVTAAISNSGYYWPQTQTTVNLAPAHVKKEGPSFDLPIAVGMVAAAQHLTLDNAQDYCLVGELALSGNVRAIKGVLPIAIEARRCRKKALFVPEANAREAAVVEGIEVYGVRNLHQVFEYLKAEAKGEPLNSEEPELVPVREDMRAFFETHRNYEVDFCEVKGQASAKRAIEVAVAGAHALLMIGPPGSGKSMLSKRIPTIIPPMSLEEAIETTKIHSVSGLLGRRSFVATRPFRSPHHTISDAGLLGGTANPSPGEVSLAHNGVLFLDELPEFKRSTLEVMRQPLEDGRVTISRAVGSMTFPAEFMLVAAMNPCPCGHSGDSKRICRCNPRQINQYRQRISGPLLDRIDIHVEVPAVHYSDIASRVLAESSAHIRARVEQARAIQQRRFGKNRIVCNARMTSRMIRAHCTLDNECQEVLRMAMESLNLSARAYDRILKVSRTIADLDQSEQIQPAHLSEAIQYRTLDRSLWA